MEFVSFKNMFRVMCSILTLALIYQVMFTYVVEKPTTTSKEEKELEIAFANQEAAGDRDKFRSLQAHNFNFEPFA